jgi:hypothetical protein
MAQDFYSSDDKSIMLLHLIFKQKLSEAYPQFIWTLGSKDESLDVILTSRVSGKTAEVLFPKTDFDHLKSSFQFDTALRRIAARAIQEWTTVKA